MELFIENLQNNINVDNKNLNFITNIIKITLN